MDETKLKPDRDTTQTPVQASAAGLDNEERLQEFSIIAMDRIRSVSVNWWYGLGIFILLLFPIYFGLRTGFTSLIVRNHTFPAYIYQSETKVPLEVIDTKIFKLADGSFGGYFKIRNSQNYNWGAASQAYTAVFSTTGGTEVTRVSGSTFVLPSSEKIVVFARFTADKVPTQLTVKLSPTQFVQKPNVPDPKLSVERTSISITNGNLTVASAVNSSTPFTISHVVVPVLLYDSSNDVVGVNYTQIDQLNYHESRTFQVQWPGNPTGIDPSGLHAEVLPEVNIYDPSIYRLSAASADSQVAPDTTQ